MLTFLNRVKVALVKCRYGDSLQLIAPNTIRKNAAIKINGGGSIKMEAALLNENVFICSSGGHISMGKGVTVNRNSIIISKEKIEIGEGSSIGPNVCIYDHDHYFDSNGFSKSKFMTGGISIGKRCWIGAGVTILRNTHIGEGCIIGAGTVVKGNISANSIVYNKRDLYVKKLNYDKEN